MESLPSTAHLLTICDLYCKETGRSASTVAQWAVKNPYFFSRLRAGKGSTVKTYCRILRYFSDRWPERLVWPDDIPRPAPQTDREEAA